MNNKICIRLTNDIEKLKIGTITRYSIIDGEWIHCFICKNCNDNFYTEEIEKDVCFSCHKQLSRESKINDLLNG